MTGSADGARVVVRFGTEADAAAAARLHAASITEGFLATLGPRFLTRLYRRIVRSPDAFLLVAVGHGGHGDRGEGAYLGDGADRGDGATAGFLAGALDLGALYRRFLLHDGAAATLSSLPRLLASWRTAWETLRHGSAGEPGTADPVAAELLSVAVDPDWRGRHVGSLLVEAFLDELGRRGVGHAQVVVGADNAVAVGLYRSCGFADDRSFELHRGTTSLIMRRPVPERRGGHRSDDAGRAAP